MLKFSRILVSAYTYTLYWFEFINTCFPANTNTEYDLNRVYALKSLQNVIQMGSVVGWLD